MGVSLMGRLLFRVVGMFPDCQPWLVVNEVDVAALAHPSQLQMEVVRRECEVASGQVGVGKRTDHRGELVDGYEVIGLLKQIDDIPIHVSPELLSVWQALFFPDPAGVPEAKSDPIGDLTTPAVQDKLSDSDTEDSEEHTDGSVDPVLTAELPTGEPQGNGSDDAGGTQPRTIKTRKGSGV